MEKVIGESNWRKQLEKAIGESQKIFSDFFGGRGEFFFFFVEDIVKGDIVKGVSEERMGSGVI